MNSALKDMLDARELELWSRGFFDDLAIRLGSG